MNLPPAARGSQVSGFTQPRDHSFAQPCTYRYSVDVTRDVLRIGSDSNPAMTTARTSRKCHCHVCMSHHRSGTACADSRILFYPRSFFVPPSASPFFPPCYGRLVLSRLPSLTSHAALSSLLFSLPVVALRRDHSRRARAGRRRRRVA